MGFESFQLTLHGGRLRPDELVRNLLADPFVSRDRGFLSSSDYLLRDDDSHKIEIEIDRGDGEPRLSMRFTLCHPASIDDVFLSLANTYRSRFGMEFKIPADADERHLREQIAVERNVWQMQFGTDTAAATTAEAFEWFIQPHCVPKPSSNGHHRQSVLPTLSATS